MKGNHVLCVRSILKTSGFYKGLSPPGFFKPSVAQGHICAFFLLCSAGFGVSAAREGANPSGREAMADKYPLLGDSTKRPRWAENPLPEGKPGDGFHHL